MNVFLYLEYLVLGLQVHTDTDIQGLILISQCVIVGVLNVTTGKLIPFLDIDIVLNELLVKIFDDKVFTLQINDGALIAFLVNQHDRTNTSLLGHKSIVSTEVRCDMYDTCAIVSRHVVTGNHLEGFTHRLDGGHQLLVLHTYEIRTLIASYDTIRNQLLAFLVFRHLAAIGDSTLSRQIGIQTSLGQYDSNFLSGIGIVSLHGYIVNLRTNAECRVSGQCPGRCRPCQEVRCTPSRHLGLRVLHLELCRTRRVLHIAIAAGLVQLVRAQTSTCSRRIRLNGIAFVEQLLLIELLQQPPQCLDILIIVCNIRIVKVNEVAHLLCQVTPLLCVHHHVLTALGVVVLR